MTQAAPSYGRHPLSYGRRAEPAGRGLSMGVWATAVTLAFFGLLTANPLLTAGAILFVPVAMTLVWRPGEVQALLFVVLFQWLQVTTRVFQADVAGVSVENLVLSEQAPAALAVWLGLAALLTLAIGHRLTAGPSLSQAALAQANRERAEMDPTRLLILYGVLFAIGFIASQGRGFLGIAQALDVISSLKWIPLFLLASVVFSGRPGRVPLAIAVGIELVLGLAGYFSGFKTVFFVLILAGFTSPDRISARTGITIGLLSVTLFGMAVVWTGIKSDYREYVSQGQDAQVIVVPWEMRMAEMTRLAADLSETSLGPVVEAGLDRLSYIDYFAESLAHVPAQVPHTGGALWLDAVRHVLTPRIFFPNKPILDSDSELTMRYTGLVVAGQDSGSSISLGYVGESYVDFGVWGMWLPLFLLGLLQGGIYRLFVTRLSSVLFGYGFAMVALLPAIVFETVAIKYLGGTLYLLIALWLISNFFGDSLFLFATGQKGESNIRRTSNL